MRFHALLTALLMPFAAEAHYATAVTDCSAESLTGSGLAVIEVTPSNSACSIAVAKKYPGQVIFVTRNPRAADVLSGITQGSGSVLSVGPGVDAAWVAAELNAVIEHAIDDLDDDLEDEVEPRAIDLSIPRLLARLAIVMGWRVL